MNKLAPFSLRAATAITMVAMLAGCASSANWEAMTPTAVATTKKLPQTVSVKTSGGSATGAMDSSSIGNDDLKAAIEKSITQSKLFAAVVPVGGEDYELSVAITRLSKPTFGLAFTVEMEAGWVLVKRSDKTMVWRKSVQSSYTASMSDAFVGVKRLQMAVEGAARQNIEQGLKAIESAEIR